MSEVKLRFIKEYLAEWQKDLSRGKSLLESDQYFIEGLLVIVCHIGALARLCYPQEQKDFKSYKTIVLEYGGKKEIYGNIDLLFLCQWPKSKMANVKKYKHMKNYSKIVSIIQAQFGDEESIKNSAQRYQTREKLVALIKENNPFWFDEGNFIEHIELFSNNQIFYDFLRCEAVHNADFPLFNRTYQIEQSRLTYKDNHQITRKIILETLQNILSNIEKECLAQLKYPWEITWRT